MKRERTLYELLELQPTATRAEVEQAIARYHAEIDSGGVIPNPRLAERMR